MTMINRIVFLLIMTLVAFSAGLTALAASAQLATPPVPGPNGMPTQSWFKESSGDLAQDLVETIKQGKLLAIVWEQRGCYYCKQMHEVNFQDHEVMQYVRRRFEFVQLNLHGNRVMLDLGGDATTEARLAQRNRVTGTPTVLFLDREGKEVFRMPGYANPPLFLTVFEYVSDRAYVSQSLRDYIAAKISDAKIGKEIRQTN